MGTDIHGIFQKRTGNTWEDVTSEYSEGRHYMLFAWLGDVRNGFGFAGVPTHERIEPLSSRRGFPEDFKITDGDYHPISENALRGRRAEYWEDIDSDVESEERLMMWMGDHSHTWLSGDEILNGNTPKILRTGIVSRNFFDKWDGVSQPEEWSGGISGKDIFVAESPSEVINKTTHVRIEWFVDTKDEFAYFIDEVKRLANLHGEVRFVFGFDS